MKINYCEFSITIIINVLLISLFIAIFFFTYGIYIEDSIIKAQMNFLATNVSDIIKLFGKNITNDIKKTINNLPNIDFTNVDSNIQKQNKTVKYNVLIANIIFFIFTILLVTFLYNRSSTKINLINILIKNFIILLFIGLTYFIFIYLYGSKFIAVDPNLLYYNIIKHLKELHNI
jgi:hypothetical protein